MAFAAFATAEAQPQAPKRKSRIALFLLLPGILYLVLFGPLLEGATGATGRGTNAYNWFIPGLLVQTAMFAAAFAGPLARPSDGAAGLGSAPCMVSRRSISSTAIDGSAWA